MDSSISIGRDLIGPNHAPYVIAEMSGNHNQSLQRALEIVDAAAASGVQAVKLQTYTPDTITLDIKGGEFDIDDPDSPWLGRSLHSLYSEAHTPWEWHKAIISRAMNNGIACFSSPFDETAVDFLEELGVPAYKIASFENNHLPLIAKAASTGKPLIMSTGVATISEVEQAVRTARNAGCKDLILLKCTSTYPASPDNTNIRTIPHMQKLFNCQVGLSDHCMGSGVAVAAVAHGATVIEKHFTLSRKEGGVDSSFSLEPNEMKSLTAEVKRAWLSLGAIKYGPTEEERKSLRFKRSIYVIKDIRPGDLFGPENIRIVRPGLGISPHFYEQLIGKRAAKSIPAGTPLEFDSLFPDG